MDINIIPDFGPRNDFPEPPPIKRLPALIKPPPKPIVIPPVAPKIVTVNPVVAPVARQIALPTVSQSIQSLIPNMDTLQPLATFSPNIETFTSNGKSYFKLNSDVTSATSDWAKFPAVSTINANNYDIVSSNHIYTSTLTATSGIITLSDQAGVQTLEAIGTDLFFDGQLLAKADDLQNISDWSLYPALSTINVNNENIINVSTINSLPYPPPGTNASQWAIYPAVSTINVNNENIINVSTINSLPYPPPGTSASEWAIYPAISTVNADKIVNVGGTFGTAGQYLSSDGSKIQWVTPSTVSSVTALNSQTGNVTISSSGGSVTITNPSAGIINLETATIGAPSWANYPAVSTVTIPNHDFVMSTSNPGLSYNTANINANVNIGDIDNLPLRPDFNAVVGNFNVGTVTNPATSMTVTSAGAVSINSAVGVSVFGGGGVSVGGVGGVSITGGGAISVQAGGINVNGGAVNLTSSSALNVAAGGILVSGGGIAINGGGVAVNAGALTIASGTVAVGTLATSGGGINVFGSDISMIPVGPATAVLRTDLISSLTANSLAITGVSTINGAVYPPSGSGVTSLNTLSGALTLLAGTGINVSSPSVSTITISNTNTPLGKYGQISGSLALTGTFANMATQTFTTTVAGAPLLVWGNFNVLDGGSGAVIEARLLINGTGGLVVTKTMTNGHNDVISLLGGGTGPTPAGVFNVALQARVLSGTASRINASVTTQAQFTLSA